MADGLFYVDTKPPHTAVSGGTITLTAALQALLPAGAWPATGSSYFGYVGKAVRIRATGVFTTGATPGNLQLNYMWGTGASANGTTLANVAVVGVANLTALPWLSEVVVRCRSLGTAGTLFTQGTWLLQNIGLVHIPAASIAAVTVDLTSPVSLINLQALRSGSTVETMQVHDLLVEALN